VTPQAISIPMQLPRTILRQTGRLIAPPFRWVASSRDAVFYLAAAGAALIGGLFFLDSSRVFVTDPFPGNVETLPVFLHVRKYAFLLMWGLLPAFILAIARFRIRRPIIPVLIASLLVFAIWASCEYFLSDAAILESLGVETAPLDTFFRLILTGGLILSPPLLMILYARCPALDRYLLRQFLVPFAFCFIGFIAIWLIIDLSDNVGDFNKNGAKFSDVLRFYIVQIPQIVVLIMPVTLLLALLYSLSKMSKTNEIISMLTAGKSLHRILRPVFFVGIYASLISLALNYEWAPQAAGTKQTIHDSITRTRKGSSAGAITAQLYRNRGDNRTWFVGGIPFDLSRGEKMIDVWVFQEDDEGRLKTSYHAEKAAWIPHHFEYDNQPTWLFRGTTILDPTNPDPALRRVFEPGDTFLPGWSETPWKLLSGNVAADHLGVPALAFHLKTNTNLPEKTRARYLTHWHDRWAAPWTCLVIVLFAAPLGIVYSRRSVLGGVAYCIFIFFGAVFSSHLCLALGQGGYIPPFAGAWATNILIAAIGLLLLHFRSRNKDFPKPTPANLKALFGGKRRRRTHRTSIERPEFI
jgi:lipopolysaccharide export system permease protein